MSLPLRTNFYWTFAGNAVYAACQWGMLVVLAKLGSPEVVGQFALGLAVTAPVIMLSNLQLRSVLATDALSEYRFDHYFGLRVVTTAVALVIIAAIAASAGYGRQTSVVILAVAVAKAFESISDIVYGSLQHEERMDRISQSMMMRGAAGVIGLWAGLYLAGSMLAGVLLMGAAWGFVLLTFDLQAVSNTRQAAIALAVWSGWKWEWDRLRRLTILAAPLGVVMMLLSLNVNVPRYIIQHNLGERALGLFAAVAYAMVAGTVLVNALGQSASPTLARYYALGDAAGFWRLMRKLLAIGGAIGIAGVALSALAGRPFLSIAFRPDYADSADVLIWVMVAGAIGYVASFLGYGVTATRRFIVQAPLIAVVTASTALACVILIPRYGLIGAAWALSGAAAVQLVGSAAVLRGAIANCGRRAQA